MVPNLLHVVPVGDDAMLNGVLEGKDASFGLGLVADIGVLKKGGSVNFAFYKHPFLTLPFVPCQP